LGDPDVSPATVAAAHYISLRYLHNLFETQETTVADWIRRRRLERCRRDLLDPALRAEPVGSIGARWGLTSPAHFTRLFRGAYGLPPAAYRAEANTAAANDSRRAH
jgi:AraC-like DNA-binding protein